VIQRGYRSLVLWITWAAAALVIFLGLYQDTNVLDFVKNDPSRITWVIIGLFILGVLTSFILTLTLTFEAVRIDQLEKIAKQKGWMGIENVSKKFGVAKFFESLKAVLANNGDINIESLVDVEFAIYQRIAHALEIIGNLLITLGLIGTVVGLTLTLTGLTSSLEALGQDQDQLLAGLRGAMGGMGTAFYTTLLGSVLGGVLLRVFAHIDENGVESLENTLTRICLVHCSADLKPSLERDMRILNSEISALTNNIKMLQNTLIESKTVMNDFANELLRLREIESDDTYIKRALKHQKVYQDALREEFQLKRMNRGLWWSVIKNSFRTK
jgi:hypothetical protein